MVFGKCALLPGCPHGGGPAYRSVVDYLRCGACRCRGSSADFSARGHLFGFSIVGACHAYLQDIQRSTIRHHPVPRCLDAGVRVHCEIVQPHTLQRFLGRWMGALPVLLVSMVWFLAPDRDIFDLAYENTNSGVHEAYEFVARALESDRLGSASGVVFGRSDQWPGSALRFHLITECLKLRDECHLDLKDTDDIREGWPRGVPLEGTYRDRLRKALNEADFVVVFGARVPAVLRGWRSVARKRFRFERFKAMKKSKEMVVTVFRPRQKRNRSVSELGLDPLLAPTGVFALNVQN